jgi:hypothetical protein
VTDIVPYLGNSRKHTYKTSSGQIVSCAKLVLWVRIDVYGTTIDDAEVYGPDVPTRARMVPIVLQTAIGATDKHAIESLFQLVSKSNPAILTAAHRWLGMRAYRAYYPQGPAEPHGARATEP